MKRVILSLSMIFPALLVLSQLPAGWTIDEVNPGQDIRLFQDDNRFTEGNKSCQVQLNSAAVPYLISENFPVDPGANYQFSIDVFDNDTTGQLKVYCDFYDAVGNNVLGEDPVFSSDSQEWKTIQWTATVPPAAVEGYVLIKFYCEPDLTTFVDKATIWVDRCTFRENDGPNLIANGGFEDWPVGIWEPLSQSGQFSIYPNPAVDHITATAKVVFEKIRITDMTGRVIIEATTNNQRMMMEVSTLPSGLYHVIFLDSEEIIGSLKLMKQ